MIVKDIATLLANTSVDQNLSYELVKPYLLDAEEQYLIPIIGQAYYAELIAYTNPEEEYKNKILQLAQRAVANMGIALYLPAGNIQISDSGAQISSTQDKKTAFEWQINRAIQSISRLAMNALEQLIAVLELNKDQIEAYKLAEVRVINESYFIRNATEFNAHYHIDRSRLTFLCLQSTARDLETSMIIPMIGAALAVDLKERRKLKTLTAADMRLMDCIYKSIAFLTIQEILPQLAVEISPFGLSANYMSMINNATYKNPAEDSRVTMLLTYVKNKSTNYLQELPMLLPTYVQGSAGTIDPTGLKIFPGF